MRRNFFIKHINYWDFNDYRSRHSDLKDKNNAQLLRHVLRYGIIEKREILIKPNKKNRNRTWNSLGHNYPNKRGVSIKWN